ncbi:MAG: Amuc_1102 family pilus-like protein [Verrucomicrobiota bacterium]
MASRTAHNQSIVSVFLALLLSAVSASAQAVRVDADEAKFDDLESPEFGGNTGTKKFRAKSWLEAEAKLRVDARGRRGGPEVKFLDRLQVNWKVAVKNPDGRGIYMLEKEVTYVNVPVGEDVYAAVYLSPSTIMRITGSDRAGKGAVEAIAGTVMYNGEEVGAFNSMGGKKWWEAASVSKTDKFPLMSKSDTPFRFLWWDRYLEEEARRQ